jgi:peptidoglycan/xylan/chitin deacetylase (PgdA/CDA1 family)
VAITFDDGYANLEDHALPVLKELGFSATIFAVTAHAGRTNDWPSQPAGVPRLPLLSLSRLRACVDEGFEVGLHTATHPPLDAVSPDKARAEVCDAKRTLEDALGGPVKTFAYPYGLIGSESDRLVREHFRAACGVVLGEAQPTGDRHRLPRIDMYYFRPRWVSEWYGTGRGRLYRFARSAGRGLRAALGWSSRPLEQCDAAAESAS